MPFPDTPSDLDELVSSYYNNKTNFDRDDAEAKSIISFCTPSENEDIDLYDLYGDHEHDDEESQTSHSLVSKSRSPSPLEGNSASDVAGSSKTQTHSEKPPMKGDKSHADGSPPGPVEGDTVQGTSEATYPEGQK